MLEGTLHTAVRSDAEAILDELSALDVRLMVDGILLTADAPKGVLTPERLQVIRHHRRELIHLVRCQGPCSRCGSLDHIDIPIHGGRSTRRDCANCRLTKGFPVWAPYETAVE